METIPGKVVIKTSECCKGAYSFEDELLIDRSIDDFTILTIEGTDKTNDWFTGTKFFNKI